MRKHVNLYVQYMTLHASLEQVGGTEHDGRGGCVRHFAMKKSSENCRR